MIRAWILLGLWAVLPAQAQVGSAGLYTTYRHKPSAAVVQSMQEEVDLLMAPYGLHFVWLSLDEKQRTVWPDLAVLTFSGSCAARSFPADLPREVPLGWTHISDGMILPFAEVDCDAIYALLFHDLSTNPPSTREKSLGRAIGRVTAHELLHIFARTAAHSDYGVDHPALTVTQLLADHLDFEALEPRVRMVKAGSQSSVPADGQSTYQRAGCATCHGSRGQGTPKGPKLRKLRESLNPIVLSAKLAKHQNKMYRRARNLRLPAPSLEENEITELVRFLNGL